MPSHENHAEVKRILALDVGGTLIKAAVFENGRPTRRLAAEPSHSAGTLDDIVGAFRRLLVAAGPVDGVGIAMPGPFDFRTGQSLMTEKFGALYGRYPAELVGIPNARFIQDATAFLLGEIRRGAAGRFRRVGGITLGTGIGSVAAIDGKPLLNEQLRPVAEHVLWKRPFQGGVVEDFLSARGLLARYPGVANVREIGERADAGEARARSLWHSFGTELAAVLTPWIAELDLQYVVIGGQIAKAFRHFAEPLAGLSIGLGDLSGDSPLYAAAALFHDHETRK